MKKLFVLLLAVAMIAGCCTAALAEEELRGPIEIRFIYHSLIDTMESKGEDYQHNRITDAHRQNSGIDFVITPALVSGEEETARRAMILASGDVPDIMVLSVEEYMQFGKSPAIWTACPITWRWCRKRPAMRCALMGNCSPSPARTRKWR